MFMRPPDPLPNYSEKNCLKCRHSETTMMGPVCSHPRTSTDPVQGSKPPCGRATGPYGKCGSYLIYFEPKEAVSG